MDVWLPEYYSKGILVPFLGLHINNSTLSPTLGHTVQIAKRILKNLL